MLLTIQNSILHVAVYLEGCCGKSENGRIQRMQNAKKKHQYLAKTTYYVKNSCAFPHAMEPDWVVAGFACSVGVRG